MEAAPAVDAYAEEIWYAGDADDNPTEISETTLEQAFCAADGLAVAASCACGSDSSAVLLQAVMASSANRPSVATSENDSGLNMNCSPR